MAATVLIQDACVLINLVATGRFEQIARGICHQFAVSQAARNELLFLRNPGGEREPIDLQPHVDAGLLQVLSVKTDQERSRYVAYAAQLDDGEAMSLALAECRHLALATDDRKCRRLVAKEQVDIKLWSTTDILKAWQAAQQIPSTEMREAVCRVRDRARFLLKQGHPDRPWWDEFLKE
jgi:predicted nucleic acid-binding protein